MSLRHLSAPVLGALAAVLAATAAAYNTGPPPDRVALCNAGPTCKDSDCHDDFPLVSFLDVALKLEGPPEAPLPATYARGGRYRLLLRVVDPSIPPTIAFGFEVAATTGCPLAAPAGMLTVIDAERTRLTSDGSIDYLEHACPSLPSPEPARCGYLPFAPGGNSWSLDWEAPCQIDAAVEFYWAINAANYNDRPTGDQIQIGSTAMAAASGCPARIPDFMVVKADCDGGLPGLEAAFTWTPLPGASGYAVFATGDRLELRRVCAQAPLPAACDPLGGPPLVFYQAAGLCADGSTGPL